VAQDPRNVAGTGAAMRTEGQRGRWTDMRYRYAVELVVADGAAAGDQSVTYSR